MWPCMFTSAFTHQVLSASLYVDFCGFVLAAECARMILRGSGLKPSLLAQIWHLADLDKDGLLDAEEWDVFCHLVKFVKQGKKLLVNPHKWLSHCIFELFFYIHLWWMYE